MKRISILILAATSFAVPACTSDPGSTTGDDVVGDDQPVDEWQKELDKREYDYNAALRIAALRLTGDLPTMAEINQVASKPDNDAKKLAYEALVQQWPTLRRWMDEGREDVGFIEQVRSATRQWDTKGRAQGLLWRGQSAKDAARFIDRFGNSLAPKEREFLDAVIRLDRSSGRRKNILVGSLIGVLALIAVAAVVGMIAIRGANAKAVANAEAAEKHSRFRSAR